METCPNNLEVGRYHDGELPPERRGAVERHVAGCAACAAELEALRGMSRAFASAGRAEMSAAFLVRMRQQALPAAREREMRSVLRLAEALTAMAAAVLVVATVGLKRAGAIEPRPDAWERAATTLQIEAPPSRQDPTQLAYWSGGGEALP